MKNILQAVAVVAVIGAASSAQAAVIDPIGAPNTGTTLTTPEATFTAGAGTTLSVGDFVANAICPLGSLGCNGSMTLTFGFDVKDVSFDYGFGNTGDEATLSIFDGLGALLGSLVLNSTSDVAFADLSGFGTLRSILFDNTASTGAGYAFGNITYTVADIAPVPVPASAPLLLAGLGGLAWFRRLRRA